MSIESACSAAPNESQLPSEDPVPRTSTATWTYPWVGNSGSEPVSWLEAPDEFLLYGVWVRMTGKRPGAGEPSAAAGRETSAYRRVPSRITTGTSSVVPPPRHDARP